MPWNIRVSPIPHAPLFIFEGQMPKSTLLIPVCCWTRRLQLLRRAGGSTGGYSPVENTGTVRVRAQEAVQGMRDFNSAKIINLYSSIKWKGTPVDTRVEVFSDGFGAS